MQWPTALDLKMGYYAIRLFPEAQQYYCTLITAWGKCKYLRLPMELSGAPDIFQEKMSSLVDHLECAQVYLDQGERPSSREGGQNFPRGDQHASKRGQGIIPYHKPKSNFLWY